MINIQNLTKSYRTKEVETLALNNVSIEIKAGEFVAIMGPSGCGKSTLLNILGMLDTATLGHYSFKGEDVVGYSEAQLGVIRKQNIGFIFQSHRLFPEFSSIENVMLPQLLMGVNKKEALSNAKEILSTLGLEKRFSFRPANLSGGEAQRVAIARALANNPNLILADEPTGNLDPVTARKVFELLHKLVKSIGISCIIATHNLDLANSMDRLITLENGFIKNSELIT